MAGQADAASIAAGKSPVRTASQHRSAKVRPISSSAPTSCAIWIAASMSSPAASSSPSQVRVITTPSNVGIAEVDLRQTEHRGGGCGQAAVGKLARSREHGLGVELHLRPVALEVAVGGEFELERGGHGGRVL